MVAKIMASPISASATPFSYAVQILPPNIALPKAIANQTFSPQQVYYTLQTQFYEFLP